MLIFAISMDANIKICIVYVNKIDILNVASSFFFMGINRRPVLYISLELNLKRKLLVGMLTISQPKFLTKLYLSLLCLVVRIQ
jgi:hypothetical protein